MRLFISVAVLLILACVVIEISAGTGGEKGNHKAGNSKEVRYSKNKSDFKKKGNGKEQGLVKEKKQRRNVEGNEKIDSNEFLKNNKNERNGKVVYEKQKIQKSNKQNKIGKNSENFKNNKNIKVVKDAAKKYKRSIESEKSRESLINDATDTLSKNEEPQSNSASKKVAKNKFDTKSRNGVEKTQDGQDEIVNIEGVSDHRPSKETASKLDRDGKSSKKIKQQQHSRKSEELCEENVDLKKRESTEETCRNCKKPGKLNKRSESLNDLPEDSYHSEEDELEEDENEAGCAEAKKIKSSKKSSETKSECEYQVDDCNLSIPDRQKRTSKNSQTSYSGGCKLEAEISTDQNEPNRRTCQLDIEQEEAENEDSINVHRELTEENEAQENIDEDEDCI